MKETNEAPRTGQAAHKPPQLTLKQVCELVEEHGCEVTMPLALISHGAQFPVRGFYILNGEIVVSCHNDDDRKHNSHAALLAFANAFVVTDGFLIPTKPGQLAELHRAALQQEEHATDPERSALRALEELMNAVEDLKDFGGDGGTEAEDRVTKALERARNLIDS